MKPLLFFDIEATGLEPASDRIVALAVVRWDADQKPDFFKDWLFNPGMRMSDEVIAVHGITNEQVAHCPLFEAHAAEIFDLVRGCDLAGYNLRNFDIPILDEEFRAAGFEWDLAKTNVIDVSGIFRKKEPRTLAGAVKFYLGAEMQGAHTATADTFATTSVLLGQLDRYPDLARMDRAALAKFSHEDERIDLAGRIRRDEKGRIVYGFGKAKGVPVVDDPGFGEWMLRQPWITIQTKRVLRDLLADAFHQEQMSQL